VSSGVRLTVLFGTLVFYPLVWVLFRPEFMPSPIEVFRAYSPLLEQGLLYHLYMSLSANIEAIGLSCALTLPLAYLTVLPSMRPAVHFLSKLRFLGLTGITVFFTVVFGGGHWLKVALLVFGMSSFLLTSVTGIVESIDRQEFDHARTLRMGPWRSTLEIVILGRVDAVLDAVRQNAAIGWVMLTMVEGLVRFEGGLGAMMLSQDKHLHLDSVFAILFVVLTVGVAQDAFLVFLRRTLCPYSELTLERR
jgi:NitT/TauT family transport system permease protein